MAINGNDLIRKSCRFDTETHEKNSKAQPKKLFKQIDVMKNEKGNIRLTNERYFN
jgi:hypothetical protein